MNNEAESALLGALIADSSMYHVISGIVTDQSFYATKHQCVFGAITQLIKDDAPVDIVSLSEILNDKVSRSELVVIANSMPTGARAEYYAERVAEKHARRKAKQTMQQGICDIDNSHDILTVLATVQQGLDQTTPQRREVSEIYPAILDTMERLIDIPKGGAKNYIPTGFYKLDKHTKLVKGTLTIVAADPGVGKTSFLLCVARHMAQRGQRPLMFTLEMTREQILENIIAQELGLCHQEMANGELSDGDMGKLTAGLNKFKDFNIGVLDGRWSINEIRHQVVTEVRTGRVDCVMIDSMGNIRPPDGVSLLSETYKIYDMFCAELVKLAVEMNIPILLTHHLNKTEGRRGRNNRPTRSSLNQAGDRWTHNVILIYREFLETNDTRAKEEAEFIVAKARDGETGIAKLGFNGPCKTFYNIEEYREPPVVWAGAKQYGN